MKNLIIEEGLEYNINFEAVVKKYSSLLEKYKYDAEDFYITSLVVESDSMNSPFHSIENSIVCIPKEFKDRAIKITCNFTCDNINLLDREYNILLNTCGIGYDDVAIPKFFI